MSNLRKFEYALEPVRRRAQWRFDAALAQLARLRSEKVKTEHDWQAIQQQCAAQSRDAADAWRHRADPGGRGRALHHLAGLRQIEDTLKERLAALANKMAQARADCIAYETKLQALQEHRTAELETFMRGESGKAAARADEDWLSHRARNSESQA